MATNDDFGSGIFDDASGDSGGDSGNSNSPIELSAESLAIAEGNDTSGFGDFYDQSSGTNGGTDDDADELDDVGADDESDGEDGDDEFGGREPLPEDQDDDAGPKQDAAGKEAASKPAWTESDRRLAAKYDLNDDDLEVFGSPAALHRAIDILDRKAASVSAGADGSGAAGGKSGASDAASNTPAGAPLRGEAGQSETGKLGIEKLDLSKYDAKDEDGNDLYDPETLAIVKHVRHIEDTLEKTLGIIESFEQTQVQATVKKNVEVFHDTLDSMPDLYGVSVKDGKPVELTKEQLSAREAVRDQAETIYAGIMAKGGEMPDLKDLFARAIRAVHGDKIAEAAAKRTTAQRQSRLRSQSQMRRTPGRKSGSEKRTPAKDRYSPDAIASDPEITEFFRNAQLENGA